MTLAALAAVSDTAEHYDEHCDQNRDRKQLPQAKKQKHVTMHPRKSFLLIINK